METTPRLIEALEGVRMQDVQAGGWHSASVSGKMINNIQWKPLKPKSGFLNFS